MRWAATSRCIEIRAARQWAVVLRVAAQGGALVDADTNDVWVASWGEYLAQLGQEGGVVQAAAVVETIPDAGAMLRSHVAGMLSDNAPRFARDVMYSAAEELPVGVADTIGYVAVDVQRTRPRHRAEERRAGRGSSGRGGRPAAAGTVGHAQGRRCVGGDAAVGRPALAPGAGGVRPGGGG